MAVAALKQELPLGVDGYRYADDDIYNVVVAAATQQRSIESAGQQFVQAPSANLVRHYLQDRLLRRLEVEVLEDRCNALLAARLPWDLPQRPQRLAIDLTLLPYYGHPAAEAGQVRRGEAKAGTTRFHCYATAYVIREGRRVTLALLFVWAEDALLDVLVELLQRVQHLDIPLGRVFLDRGFASVAILTYLERQPFTSVVALPKRGARLQALLTGRRGYRTTHTMTSAVEGSITFPLWVACHYRAGRRGQHGIEYQPFAVLGQLRYPRSVPALAKEYRQRFGVETGYRLMNQVRARTTSREPGLRLLLVGIACLVTNLWLYLKAVLVASTPWGLRAIGRRWLDAAFRLDRLCDLLLEAIKARYQAHTALRYPFRLAAPLKL